MHCLENMLLILSKRIRRDTGDEMLADDCAMLASASHDYVPARSDEPLAPINYEWTHRYTSA